MAITRFWFWTCLGALAITQLTSVYVAATSSDVAVVSLSIQNPPNYTPDVEHQFAGFTAPTVTVKNNGPDTLPGNAYDLAFYLAESSTMQNPLPATTTLTIGSDSSKLADSLSMGSSVEFQTWSGGLTYPSDKCATYSHFCIAIEKNTSALYVDSNPDNDYKCLPFRSGSPGTVAGQVNCPTDPSLTSISVTGPADVTFDTNTSTTVTVDIAVFNSGGIPLTLDGTVGDFELEAYVCDGSDITDGGCSASYVNVSTVQSLTVQGWETRSVTGVTTDILIDEDTCADRNFLCFLFVKGEGASYTDDDESNNLACQAFGDQSEGKAGTIICPGNSGSGEPCVTYQTALVAMSTTLAVITYHMM